MIPNPKHTFFAFLILLLIVIVVSSDANVMPIGLLLAMVFVLSNEIVMKRLHERFANYVGPALQDCSVYGNSLQVTGSSFYPLSTNEPDNNFSPVR